MKISPDLRRTRRWGGAILGSAAAMVGLLAWPSLRLHQPNVDESVLLIPLSLGCLGLGALVGALAVPVLGGLIDGVTSDPFAGDRVPKPASRQPGRSTARKSPGVQFTLGRLMAAVLVAGVVLAGLTRVPDLGVLVLVALAALLLTMGVAAGFACIGVLFGRLSLPSAHPLSDHAVGHFDREPTTVEADPGIVFEPDGPPHRPAPGEA